MEGAVAEPRMERDPDALVAVEDVVRPVTGLSVRSSPDSKGDLAAGMLLNFSRSRGAGDNGRRSGERGLRELDDCDDGDIDLLRGAKGACLSYSAGPLASRSNRGPEGGLGDLLVLRVDLGPRGTSVRRHL